MQFIGTLENYAVLLAVALLLSPGDAVNILLCIESVTQEHTGDDNLSSTSQIPNHTELKVDAKTVFSLITTNKEPEERLNKVALAIMHVSFNSGILDLLSWCPGYYHASDSLTKYNRVAAALLLKILRDGRYPIHSESIIRYSPNKGRCRTQSLIHMKRQVGILVRKIIML